MHAFWKKNHLGKDISLGDVPRLEIYESKLIGNASKVYWMFAIICHEKKNAEYFVYVIIDYKNPYYLL